MNYFKSLKLQTGELIAAKLEHNYMISDLREREKYITLHDPVVYSSFKFLDPQTDQIVDTVSMAPLNGITDDRAVVIEASLIMFINELRPSTIERYERFLSQLSEFNSAGDITTDDLDVDSEPLEASDIPEELAEFLLQNMPKTKPH